MDDGPLCSIPVSSIFKKKTIVKKNEDVIVVKQRSITQNSEPRGRPFVVTRENRNLKETKIEENKRIHAKA